MYSCTSEQDVMKFNSIGSTKIKAAKSLEIIENSQNCYWNGMIIYLREKIWKLKCSVSSTQTCWKLFFSRMNYTGYCIRNVAQISVKTAIYLA